MRCVVIQFHIVSFQQVPSPDVSICCSSFSEIFIKPSIFHIDVTIIFTSYRSQNPRHKFVIEWLPNDFIDSINFIKSLRILNLSENSFKRSAFDIVNRGAACNVFLIDSLNYRIKCYSRAWPLARFASVCGTQRSQWTVFDQKRNWNAIAV